jgi:hypothetical protein
MSITKNGSGEIIYTQKVDKIQSDRFGVHTTEEFQIADKVDQLKQLNFDLASMSAASRVKFLLQNGTPDSEITITFPSTNTTLGGGGAGNYGFTIIQCDSGTSPTASVTDVTLTLTSANNKLSVVGNSSTDTVTLTVNEANLVLSNMSGTLGLTQGGTGQITAQLSMNALAGGVTSGSYLRGNGTNVVLSAIQAADVPTLNQNTSGTASNITASSNTSLTTLSNLVSVGTITTGVWNGTAIAHSALSGLTSGDDHTQYLKLLGRASGQTVSGGTAASETLTINSTTHATKGKVIIAGAANLIGDEVNARVGVGTASPAARFHVKGSADDYSHGMYLENYAGQKTRLYSDSGAFSIYSVSDSFTLMYIQTGSSGNVLFGQNNPTYKLNVEKGSTNTTISTLTGTDVACSIVNTSATSNNFSSLLFGNSTSVWDSGIFGVHDTHAAAGSQSGHLEMFVTNAGTRQRAVRIAKDKVVTMDAYAKGLARFDASGVVSVATESTGAGSALLGANSPAATLTAPYTWISFTSSDGSTVYVPAWK